jgi:hypothetical protein
VTKYEENGMDKIGEMYRGMRKLRGNMIYR